MVPICLSPVWLDSLTEDGGGVIQNGKKPARFVADDLFIFSSFNFLFFFYKNCTKNDVGVRLSGDHQDCYLHFILKDLFPGGWVEGVRSRWSSAINLHQIHPEFVLNQPSFQASVAEANRRAPLGEKKNSFSAASSLTSPAVALSLQGRLSSPRRPCTFVPV